MTARVRRSTKAQGDREIVRYQQSLTGGMNVDEQDADSTDELTDNE